MALIRNTGPQPQGSPYNQDMMDVVVARAGMTRWAAKVD